MTLPTTLPISKKEQELRAIVQKRILVLDGAMGSLIQEYKLTEKDFRGKLFKDYHRDIQGNNEVLNLTRPDVIKAIHNLSLIHI